MSFKYILSSIVLHSVVLTFALLSWQSNHKPLTVPNDAQWVEIVSTESTTFKEATRENKRAAKVYGRRTEILDKAENKQSTNSKSNSKTGTNIKSTSSTKDNAKTKVNVTTKPIIPPTAKSINNASSATKVVTTTKPKGPVAQAKKKKSLSSSVKASVPSKKITNPPKKVAPPKKAESPKINANKKTSQNKVKDQHQANLKKQPLDLYPKKREGELHKAVDKIKQPHDVELGQTKHEQTENSSNTKFLDDISEAISTSTANREENKPVSISEIQYIRAKIMNHWNTTAFSGINNSHMQVKILISLEKNGEIKDAVVSEKFNTDLPQYNIFIESAIRSIYETSPLDKLPKEKYNSWKKIEFTFDSSGILY